VPVPPTPDVSPPTAYGPPVPTPLPLEPAAPDVLLPPAEDPPELPAEAPPPAPPLLCARADVETIRAMVTKDAGFSRMPPLRVA
jgi:hypothetical protein